MVHVFCLNEDCRRVLHLGNHKHWSFKGKVKCIKCGAEMNLEIKNGELKSLRKPEGK
jgi:hypothetical protein